MQVQNIQSQNFQGRAIIVGNYPGSYGSKHLQDAVRQLNTMKVIKNNEFDVFVDDSWWDGLRVTAAKNKEHIRKYRSKKITSLDTSRHTESIISAAKLVSYKHRNKLAEISKNSENTVQTQSLWQRFKKLFTRK